MALEAAFISVDDQLKEQLGGAGDRTWSGKSVSLGCRVPSLGFRVLYEKSLSSGSN